MAKPDSKENDLTKSGRINTTVETKTEVEDRTEVAIEVAPVEYHATDETVGKYDTVLTTYGEPIGGRPEAEVSE